MRTGRFERYLRWNPPASRARYGTELVALMEHTNGPSGPLPARARFGIVWAGVAERLRHSGLAGGGAPGNRLRSGALLVLCGWSLFVVAGSGFAKVSEHWQRAMPKGDRLLPTGAYQTVQTAAAVGLVVVGVAALTVLPSFARLLRRGGWPTARVPVLLAAGAGAVAIVTTVGAVLWSRLRPARPFVGPVPLLGVGWALILLTAIAVLTLSIVWVAKRLSLPVAVLRLEGALAVVLTLAMCAVLGGTVTWWGAIATDAPTFISGSHTGLFSTPGALSMTAAGSLMTAGLALGIWGDTRVIRALRASGR